MPARAEASHEEFDELCDLDILQARTVRFKLQGEWHDLEPITTQRFFDFWSAMTGYQKAEHKTPEAENAAFLALLSAVCKSVTLEHVAQMTMVQKGLLLSHITSKIIGKSLSEPLEKKKLTAVAQ